MANKDICILINTTSKYLPLVDVQLTCIQRYAKKLLEYPIYVASDSTPEFLTHVFPVDVIKVPLIPSESGFIESRIAAIEYIEQQFVLLLQDDFWIDRPIQEDEWNLACKYIRDKDIASIRLMPCPGPMDSHPTVDYSPFSLISKNDTYRFTLQATLWRAESLSLFLKSVLFKARVEFAALGMLESDWNRYCIRHNVAENSEGQGLFEALLMKTMKHLAIPRRGSHPGAVNLATIPYRPTAVVQGKLEPWAKDFAIREGFKSLAGWF